MGAIPKLDWKNFPERHLGLVPTPEHDCAKDAIDAASQIAHRYLDLEALAAVAYNAPGLPVSDELRENTRHLPSSIPHPRPRIGVIKDSAFQFYYPENIEALEAEGAEIVFVSPLMSDKIPPVDALYIGGGFPETHARQLAENISFRKQLKALAENASYIRGALTARYRCSIRDFLLSPIPP